MIIGYVLQVSPAPGSPTFNDVPVSDPAFQYIEALVASGVTAGCGGGNYCPDSPLTRRQMAVFLAKALGLQWP
jgi:S-layer homology domain